MHKTSLPVIATCLSILSACGSGSSSGSPGAASDGIANGGTPPEDFTTPIVEFPAFTITYPDPLELSDVRTYDRTSDAHQVLTQSGIAATASAIGTIDGDFETFCEVSYLSTTAATAEAAYGALANGSPETVFAFETDLDSLEIFSINAVAIDGRIGEEFLYRLSTPRGNEISGQGRAFYFNDDLDRLRRSAILYFECFGFTEAFSRNAGAVRDFLDSPVFGPQDPVASATRHRVESPATEHAPSGESIIRFPMVDGR